MPSAISVNMLSQPERSEVQAAHEERPAAPEHRGNGDQRASAIAWPPATGRAADRRRRHALPMSMASSASDSGTATHEPAGEIDAAPDCRHDLLRRHAHRLERHAADRAMARVPPARSPDASGRCRACLAAAGFGLAPLGRDSARVGGEFGAAAFRAEMIGLAAHGRRTACRAFGSTFIPQTGSVAIAACGSWP